MAEIKKISTEFQLLDKFLDTSGDAGTSGQVLSSTATGINWVSGSSLPGGPYLPLVGGTMNTNANINMNSGSLSSVDYIDFGIGQLNGVSTSNLILKSLGDITYNVDSNNNGNSSHIFQESGSELMRIRYDGNVGIGTTSPGTLHGVTYGTTKLHVDGGTDRGQMILEGDSLAGIIMSDNGATANERVFSTMVDGGNYQIKPLNDNGTSTAGGAAITVLHNSNVGIGETSPDFRLDVSKGYTSGNGKVAKFRSGNDATFVNFDTVQVVQTDVPCLAIIETSTGTQADEQKLTFAVGDNKAIIGSTSTVTNGMSFYTNRAVTTTGFTAQGNLALHLANAGNVGINTTNPQAFTKLDVRSGDADGNAAIAGYGYNGVGGLGVLGHAYAVDNAHAGSATGIRGISNGGRTVSGSVNIGGYFTAAGSENNYALITDSGNVGIGAAAPLRKLHVVGNFAVNAATDEYYGVNISGGEGSDPKITIGDWHNSGSTLQWDSSARSLNLDTQYSTSAGTFNITGNDGASTFLTILPSGNVGIGTTSPGLMLDVAKSVVIGSESTASSTTNIENVLKVKGKNNYSDGTTWYGDYGQILLSANNNMTASARQFLITNALDNNKFAIIRSTDWSTPPSTNSTATGVNSGTADFVINDTGNVGIGVTGPSTKLEVAGHVTINSPAGASQTSYGLRLRKTNSSSAVQAGGEITASVYPPNTNAANLIFKTANASANLTQRMVIDGIGNVGIGTTSPTAAKLVVSSDTAPQLLIKSPSTGSSAAQILLEHNDGLTQNASITFDQGAQNTLTIATGYQSSTDLNRINIAPAGDVGLTVRGGTGSSSGNVGIGTTSPSVKLDVNGEVLIASGEFLSWGTSGTTAIEGSTVSNKITFRTQSTERMRIDSSGNVGIGTTNPGAKLEIAGFSTAQGLKMKYGNSSGTIEAVNFIANGGNNGVIGMQMVSAGVGDLWLGGSGGRSLTLYRDGNVGIGTDSPSAPLSVVGSYSSSDEIVQIGGGTGINTDFKLKIGAVDQDYIWFQSVKPGDNYYDLVFNPTAGNVGIGTTSPGALLDVDGDIRADRFVDRGNPSTYLMDLAGTSKVNHLKVNSTFGTLNFLADNYGYVLEQSTTKANPITFRFDNDRYRIYSGSSGEALTVLRNRNVGIRQTNPTYNLDVTGNGRFTSTVTATNFILSSDERLKENVEKVCNNKVKADWKTFELKTEKGQRRYGVIAQELEKTNPEFVREDSQGFKSVAYIDLLIAKIAELEARLEKLEK